MLRIARGAGEHLLLSLNAFYAKSIFVIISHISYISYLVASHRCCCFKFFFCFDKSFDVERHSAQLFFKCYYVTEVIVTECDNEGGSG